MSPGQDLISLLSAFHGADEPARARASRELLRLIMVFVRSQMGPQLRHARESDDVCQSVAKSVVADLGGGKLELRAEGELVEYLRTAVRHKLIDLARMDAAAKRGGGVTHVTDADRAASSVDDDEAHQHAQLRAIWDELNADERELAQLRMRSVEWEHIARQTGRTTESLRQQWSRMIKRLRA